MHYFASLAAVALLPCAFGAASTKRGLVDVNGDDDSKTWTQSGSDLTWYYNYKADPSPSYKKSKLQFVPMLWGQPSSETDTAFIDSVRKQIKDGAKIPYVLGFNEPDGYAATGGSNITPEDAAAAWKREIQPLKDEGVKLGAPAVTGAPSGAEWLSSFMQACKDCTFDFVPVHWYGNFEGLASHVGEVHGTFPNSTLWVTEYGLPNASLKESQTFANQSSEFLDRLDYVSHYAYFGSFRSTVSNVGPNGAMLNGDGKLTDIGAYYLNVPAKGVKPNSAVGRTATGLWWVGLAAVLSVWCA